MKRSEREKELLAVLDEFWRRTVPLNRFDPEEEPLPEEITYSDTGRLCALNGRWLELREIREAVRRWSAVRRVRIMIAEGPSFCATEQQADKLRAKILAILDGKEEQR